MTTTVNASDTRVSAPVSGIAALEKAISPRFLSLQDRERIYTLHQSGESIRSIAQSTGRSPATVSRELRRNVSVLGYQPYSAHRQSVARRPRPKSSKLAMEGALREYVVQGLEVGWSPEQTSHRMIADHPDNT